MLALSACGNITNPFADEGRLESIAISGDTLLAVGDTVRLSTRGKVGGLTGLFTYDRVLDAVWSVFDPKIASIVPVKPIAGDTTSGSAIILTGLRPGSVYAGSEVVVQLDAERTVTLASRNDAIQPKDAKRSDVRKILNAAAAHFDELVDAWEKMHQ